MEWVKLVERWNRPKLLSQRTFARLLGNPVRRRAIHHGRWRNCELYRQMERLSVVCAWHRHGCGCERSCHRLLRESLHNRHLLLSRWGKRSKSSKMERHELVGTRGFERRRLCVCASSDRKLRLRRRHIHTDRKYSRKQDRSLERIKLVRPWDRCRQPRLLYI